MNNTKQKQIGLQKINKCEKQTNTENKFILITGQPLKLFKKILETPCIMTYKYSKTQIGSVSGIFSLILTRFKNNHPNIFWSHDSGRIYFLILNLKEQFCTEISQTNVYDK